jgi:hypothetical protein
MEFEGVECDRDHPTLNATHIYSGSIRIDITHSQGDGVPPRKLRLF